MIYELYHKNIPVLSVEYDNNTGNFGKIISINNEKHIPVGIKGIKNGNLSFGLQFWWKSRLIPLNRKGFKLRHPEIDKLFLDNPGFNLSDQYWIKKEGSDLTWKKGNFFTNSFNENIGKYITEEKNNPHTDISAGSPDLFSNGEQDKRWRIIRGKRYLIKYGCSPYYEQPFNEVLASEICRRLGFSYVPYSFLVKDNSEPVIYSSCPCFVDEHTEFVPAGFVQYATEKNKSISSYDHLLQCCVQLGMNDLNTIKKDLTGMVVLDYIIGNTDRHYGNFGFIRDAETLEWKGPASNFDTGNSMFYDYPTSDLRKSTSLMENVKCKSFASTQRKQLEKFAAAAAELHIDFSRLSRIDTYYNSILQKNPKSDDERRQLLTKILMQRIENAEEIVYCDRKSMQRRREE